MNTQLSPVYLERRIEMLEKKIIKAKHLNAEMGCALRRYQEGRTQDQLFTLLVDGLIARSELK